jgi:hypothetical protein
MHLALKRVQIFSIILAILEEFLMNSLFHETKIPTVDMKVQVYSKFSQKNWIKKKSASSMKNGRFHPPKYRGKLQKMGVLYNTLQNEYIIFQFSPASIPQKVKN